VPFILFHRREPRPHVHRSLHCRRKGLVVRRGVVLSAAEKLPGEEGSSGKRKFIIFSTQRPLLPPPPQGTDRRKSDKWKLVDNLAIGEARYLNALIVFNKELIYGYRCGLPPHATRTRLPHPSHCRLSVAPSLLQNALGVVEMLGTLGHLAHRRTCVLVRLSGGASRAALVGKTSLRRCDAGAPYSDETVANRDFRVWHGATENGP
jgi:hypothetical protein